VKSSTFGRPERSALRYLREGRRRLGRPEGLRYCREAIVTSADLMDGAPSAKPISLRQT
jgi:hypothetical protein